MIAGPGKKISRSPRRRTVRSSAHGSRRTKKGPVWCAPGLFATSLVAGALHRGLDGGPLVAELGEGLFEDGLAVGVATPLLHVREMRLVRLVARGRRGGLGGLAGGETAPGAVPLVRYGDVGREARPGFVPVRAVERHPHARCRFAPLGLSHRAGTDTAAPNGVATTHGLLLAIPAVATRTRRPSNTAGMPEVVRQPWWPCANSRPSAMIDTNQMTPVPIVSRSRLRSTTDDPPSDELIPPPKRSDRPPPLPLWRRTSNTISELVMMRTMEVPMITAVQRFRDYPAGRGEYSRIQVNRFEGTSVPPPVSAETPSLVPEIRRAVHGTGRS